MPSHWTPMPEAVQVSYVELPLPPGCSPVTGNQTVVPKLPPMDEGTLQAMMQQVPLHGNTYVCSSRPMCSLLQP